MTILKQLCLPVLLTLSVVACGQPTNRPAPQPEPYSLSGTVYAPTGQDVAGTAVVACYVVADACDEAKTVYIEISDSGASAPFALSNLEELTYDLYAAKDVNGDGDYFGEGDFYGEVSAQVTPPKTGLELRLSINGDTTDPGEPGPDATTPEPNIVKGRVTNSQGQPLEGVEIIADNTLFYDSNVIGYSGASGYYRLDLSAVPGTYRMSAKANLDYGDQTFVVDLLANDDREFAGPEGAIRNFTLTLEDMSGDVLVNTAIGDYTPYQEIELTLEPLGPIVDGSAGQTLTSTLTATGDGWVVESVPYGHYKVTARHVPTGAPMLVSRPVTPTQDYEWGESYTGGEFEPLLGGGTYQMRVEVKLP